MPAPENVHSTAIIFDLDDTLYPEREYAFSGFRAVADAFATRLSAPCNLFDRMCQIYDTPDRHRVFDALLAELGCSAPFGLVAEMVATFRAHVPRIHLHADADRALARLAGQCRLGVLSDGALAVQQAKVDALALAGRVGAVVLTDQWGRPFWKPHPRGFEDIADRLGVCHDHCAYVADNRAKDFVAPNALGWRTVLIRRPDGVYRDAAAPAGGEPQRAIDSLDDVEAVLA